MKAFFRENLVTKEYIYNKRCKIWASTKFIYIYLEFYVHLVGTQLRQSNTPNVYSVKYDN